MSLEIRRRLGDAVGEAAILSNLAIVAEQEGDYETARSLNQQALALRNALGDRWALGVSHTNLGMICLLQEQPSAARDHFQEALRLNLEIGDPWMVAISRHNLANAERDLGANAAAAQHYGEALSAYRSFDDRWALAILLEDMTPFAVRQRQPRTALQLAGAADRLREQIGSPRSASQEAALGRALETAGAQLAAELRASGLILSHDELDGIISGLWTHAHLDG
jgi:tetratricopeptide (TPR) repeat protein